MRVFVDAGGQHDNVGDSVLRRAYVQALRPIGQLEVLAVDPPDYLPGLDLQPQDVVYPERQPWLRAARSALLRGRICFAYNCGELWEPPATEQRRPTAEQAIAWLNRLRGGAVVMAGNSVRWDLALAKTLGPGNARSSSVLSWRDQCSATEFGAGETNPDWAFALGAPASLLREPGERRLITVAMRGDRPEPDPDWCRQVRDFAAAQGCRVQVVVQVRRDGVRAEQLATWLDADLLSWPEADDHATQEARLREVYRHSQAVLSDRVHALIIAMTEGAVPIGVTTLSPEKVRRLFAVVSALPIAPDEAGDTVRRWQLLLNSRPQLSDELAAARLRLDGLRARILAAAS